MTKYRVLVLIEMPIVVEAENEDDAVNKALRESADVGGPGFLIRGVVEGDGRKQVGKEMRGLTSDLFRCYPVCTEKEYQDFLDFCDESQCIAGNTPLSPRGCWASMPYLNKKKGENTEQYDKGTYLLLSKDGEVIAVSGNSEFDDIDKPPMENGTIVCVVGNYS